MAARSRSLTALAALGALVVVGLGGFRLWTLANEPSPSSVAEPFPDDDLVMLAALTDAGAPSRDRLAAGAGRLVVAHGSDGTVDVQLADGGATTVLAHVGAPVAGLALGPDAAWVTAGRTVRRLPFDGGAPVVVTDQLVRPHAIAVGDGAVFVVDVDPTTPGMLRASRVLRLGATPPAALAVLGSYQGEVDGITVDRGDAFWADPLAGSVLAATAQAATPTILASERGLPGAVVVVADQVVWVEKRSESLWTVTRTGGTPRRLAQDFAGFAHLTAHGDRVAWVNEAAVEGKFRVLEVPVAGGDVTAVSRAVDAVDALACDGKRLFWLRDGAARSVDAAATGD